jgi:hypothetical protein
LPENPDSEHFMVYKINIKNKLLKNHIPQNVYNYHVFCSNQISAEIIIFIRDQNTLPGRVRANITPDQLKKSAHLRSTYSR